MIFITGDTHGQFGRIKTFCDRIGTSKDDVLIILGDAGINYYGNPADRRQKKFLESLPITIFAIHGNHEKRPSTIPGYHETSWRGGNVYVEDAFPDILFAKDGEIYELAGKRTIVIGGAYSVDKQVRLANGWKWWADEQPSDEIKKYVEQQLDDIGWKIDVVLSHTVPLKYEPTEVFLKGLNQSLVDKSTEAWLDQIENRLTYEKWYAGHYHTQKKIERLEIMFENFDAFGDMENPLRMSSTKKCQ